MTLRACVGALCEMLNGLHSELEAFFPPSFYVKGQNRMTCWTW